MVTREELNKAVQKFEKKIKRMQDMNEAAIEAVSE